MTGELTNLELKARCDDLNRALALAASLQPEDLGSSHDVDTYFRVPRGRLKLRERSSGRDTLIYYDRLDAARSRYSNYYLSQVPDGPALKALMTAAFGVLVVVTKKRQLLMCGNTRIHLDQVEGLGCFVELETVLRGQGEGAARIEHEHVKAVLKLDKCELVPVSYSDLLLRTRSANGEE